MDFVVNRKKEITDMDEELVGINVELDDDVLLSLAMQGHCFEFYLK